MALPYLKSTKGIGMKAIEMKASVDEAQATPRFLYIAEANNGCNPVSRLSHQERHVLTKPAPNIDLKKSFPANTLAAYSGYASDR